MKSLISIIIPVYNRSHELIMALGSIQTQTYDDIEVIVIDDGSTEDIENIIKRFDKMPIKYFKQNNAGAPSARNRGFEMSKGEFVIFWDADIVGKPDMLEKMHNALKKNPNASYAYSDHTFGFKKMPARPFDADTLKELNYITSTSLIRREKAVKWDESLKRFQDWDIWLTMLDNGDVGIYVPENLFHIESKGSTMSNWLPRFAYKKPWKWLPCFRSKVKPYELARDIVKRKHNI